MHKRLALPNVDSFHYLLDDGEPLRLYLRLRKLHAVPFAVRQRHALCKLHALPLAVRQRHSQLLCHGVSEILCEREPQRFALPVFDALLLFHFDGEPYQLRVRLLQLLAVPFSVRQRHAQRLRHRVA